MEQMSGYDVRKHFGESLSYFWNESYGQIYPTLKQLAKEGLVAAVSAGQAGKRDRQVYSLTSKGRDHLREWLAKPPQNQPIRNEFLLKLFLGRSPPRGALCEHIGRFRTEQEELLAMFLIIQDSVRIEHAKSPNLKYWMLGLKHGVGIRRAEIKWCNEPLRVLDSASAKRKAHPRRSGSRIHQNSPAGLD